MISPLRQRREQSSTFLKFLTRDPNLDKFFENCTSHGVQEVKEMYDKFVNERSEVNPLFAFWSKYINAIATHTSYTDYGLASSPKYSEIDDILVFHNRSRELFTLRTLLLDGNDVPRTIQSMYVQVLALVT